MMLVSRAITNVPKYSDAIPMKSLHPLRYGAGVIDRAGADSASIIVMRN